MVLHATLCVNGHSIGQAIEIVRKEPKDVQTPDLDTICTYRVAVHDIQQYDPVLARFEIEHRYGDGSLVLMARAMREFLNLYKDGEYADEG